MEEKDIIASVLRGETERFGILAERYSAPIYRLCVSLCGNSADAEDAVQETFFDAFRYLATLTDTVKFFPWLCFIARQKALRQMRYRHSDTDIDALAESLSYDGDFPAEDVIREENRERVLRAVGSLSDKRREVCELFYFRNMSVSAIAKKLSLSENTVKSRLFDSGESLRKELYDPEVHRETVAAPEGNIRELLKRLSYYYSLNGCWISAPASRTPKRGCNFSMRPRFPKSGNMKERRITVTQAERCVSGADGGF